MNWACCHGLLGRAAISMDKVKCWKCISIDDKFHCDSEQEIRNCQGGWQQFAKALYAYNNLNTHSVPASDCTALVFLGKDVFELSYQIRLGFQKCIILYYFDQTKENMVLIILFSGFIICKERCTNNK